MKLKFLLAFAMLAMFSCSTENIDSSPIQNTSAPSTDLKLTLVNNSSISTTPFFEPRATVIYNDLLYAVDETSTYKYDFGINLWQKVISNTNNFEIASNLNESSNISFIRNNKWYIVNSKAISSYEFETRNWTLEKQFGDNEGLNSPEGVYSNGNLYIFSREEDKIYTYDFSEKTFEEHISIDLQSDYGQLVNPIIKVNGSYYYTKLDDYRTISIYKFDNNFTDLNFVDKYVGKSFDKGVSFVYGDKIIFGLGGNLNNSQDDILNSGFDYFDTNSGTFGTVDKEMYEARYIGLPFEYGSNYYLLGGTTIENTNKIARNSLVRLKFDFVIQ